MRKIFLVLLFISISSSGAFAQLEKPVSWSYFAKKTAKNEATIYLKATMESRWHIYSLTVKGGPTPTSFAFSPSKDFSLIGKANAPKPMSKYDKNLKTDLTYYEDEVVFSQKIKLNKPTTIAKVEVEFMACNDKACLPSDRINLSIPIK